MGIDNGMAHRDVRALIKKARARIRAHGKPQMDVVSDLRQAREAATAGARMIAVLDAALLGAAGRDFLSGASKLPVTDLEAGLKLSRHRN